MTAIDEREMTADERYIRAGLVDGSLVAVGASAIRPLLDEIDRLRALSPGSTGETEGWQPIETAPMDGTRILATDGDTVAVVEWGDISMGSTKGWQISCNSDSGWNYYDYLVDPTHWMPLPSPPSAMLAAAGGRDAT